jgi:group I intron endonuclease
MDNLLYNIHENIENNITNTGIYKIECISNKRFYIGSSLHISTRIRSHFNNLRINKHINKSLQNSYNKYGELFFRVECVQCVDNNIDYNNLILLEQKYLDILKPWNEKIGFNLCKVAAKPPSRTGAIFTEEHKHNIAKAQKERHRQRSSNYVSPLKGKTAREIHGPDWVDPRKGRTLINTKNGGKKDISSLTLIHVQTNNVITKTCYKWRKEGIDVHALKCNRQITSKHWSLYNSGIFP